MAIDVAVLVSIGRHPVSGRARRADADARAVELALGIAGANVHLVHAGDPDEPALRDYMGMGANAVTVLRMVPDADPVPALTAHLSSTKPQIVLAGTRAEGGEDSGLVPYLVAQALNTPLVPGIVSLSLVGDRAEMLQGLPRGRRRSLVSPVPLVATVPVMAPAPRMSAFGLARRGMIEVKDVSAVTDAARAEWTEGPARRRPKRIKVMKAASAADRVRAVTEMAAGKGKVLQNVPPDEAAKAIFDYLVTEGIIQAKP